MAEARPSLSLGDRFLVGAAGAAGPVLVKLLGSTWRITVTRQEIVERAREPGKGVIYAFWHGFLLPLEYVYRGSNIHVLSSWHRDGEISARLMTSLGYGVVRGSTSRGSTRGLMRMLGKAVDGFDLAITPDGPRGPAHTVSRGIFYLSEKSGAPIVPAAAGASRAKHLSSWDSFMVPLPFARLVVAYGEPLRTTADEPFEEKAARLKASLDRLSEEAAALAGD